MNEPAYAIEEEEKKMRTWNWCMTEELYLGFSFKFQVRGVSTLVKEGKTKQLW